MPGAAYFCVNVYYLASWSFSLCSAAPYIQWSNSSPSAPTPEGTVSDFFSYFFLLVFFFQHMLVSEGKAD